MHTSGVVNHIAQYGWIKIHNLTEVGFMSLISELGSLVSTADIKVQGESTQFIHSSGYVEFHTDDPRADYVVWRCIETADEGGENILKDIKSAYLTLSEKHQKALQSVNFFVDLPGAPIEVKCVTQTSIGPHFYYAPWKKGNRTELEREALFLLTIALRRQKTVTVALQQEDVLIIDNRRIVHGRAPYRGDKRHLKRFLIATTQ